jgi:hypothetical protein
VLSLRVTHEFFCALPRSMSLKPHCFTYKGKEVSFALTCPVTIGSAEGAKLRLKSSQIREKHAEVFLQNTEVSGL